MVTELPWLIGCVEKFDATNVTSQSDMLIAIKNKAEPEEQAVSSGLSGDDEIVL
jgi:hypothetical protein